MRRWLERRRKAPASPVATVFDPTDPAFVADPYPLFSHLRDQEPVHRTPMGAWAITRYADVKEALADRRLSNAPARHAVVNARNRERYLCADVAANILPFLDAPEHVGPRRVIARAFHERLRESPPPIEAMAGELLDRWTGSEVRDVVADYASPLALGVIGRVLGVPAEDAGRLDDLSETFFYLFAAIPSTEVRERLDRALGEFRAYLDGLVADRRLSPGDDLISMLVNTPPEDRLSDAQIVDNCMLLFADGVENVDRTVGNATYALLCNPDEMARLVDEPVLMRSAVAECLRFESPAQYIARIAREPVTIRGVEIPAGSAILLVLGSANRDEKVFAAADRLDIRRDPNPHLAFGRGPHGCLGGSLVESQTAVALSTLLVRMPRMTLAHPATFVARPAHRWVESVQVHPQG